MICALVALCNAAVSTKCVKENSALRSFVITSLVCSTGRKNNSDSLVLPGLCSCSNQGKDWYTPKNCVVRGMCGHGSSELDSEQHRIQSACQLMRALKLHSLLLNLALCRRETEAHVVSKGVQ